MKREEKIFEHKGVSLAYTVYGEGNRTTIGFYGFNQSDVVFQPYALSLEKEHRFYCIDLFFHGRSVWPYGDKALSKELWKEIFEGFRAHEGIQEFSMIGFSLGAKVLLATLETFPEAVRSITLIAPDGIRLNTWYKLATSCQPFTYIFKQTISKPWIFYRFISLLERLYIVDKRLARFTRSQMKTHVLRSKVFYTWMVYRAFSFSTSKIAAIVNQKNIATTIILGDNDKVINYSKIKSLIHKIDRYELETLKANHYNLLRKALARK